MTVLDKRGNVVGASFKISKIICSHLLYFLIFHKREMPPHVAKRRLYCIQYVMSKYAQPAQVSMSIGNPSSAYIRNCLIFYIERTVEWLASYCTPIRKMLAFYGVRNLEQSTTKVCKITTLIDKVHLTPLRKRLLARPLGKIFGVEKRRRTSQLKNVDIWLPFYLLYMLWRVSLRK